MVEKVDEVALIQRAGKVNVQVRSCALVRHLLV